ncbi:MAG: class I SAM-dependent RNA methyltransferase, partial [Victivallaceae bacterium]
MEIGTRIKVEIEKCVFGGNGLARHEGQVVFVDAALPGEILIAEVTAVKSNFLRAKAVKFGTLSPRRIEPECPAFLRCPGCSYCHVDYAYETELKDAQLRDFVAQAGLEPVEGILPAIAPEPAYGYRNKLSLHVNKEGSETMIGYVADDKQTVTPIDHCPLAHPAINAELAKLLATPGFRHSVHNRMDLTFRYTPRDGVKFFRNAPPRNATWLREETSVGELAVPAGGFFQVNPGGVEALIGALRELLRQYPVKRFIDLYCGVGLFSAVAAEAGVAEIRGAELAEDAVTVARYNLTQRGRADAVFVAADACEALPGLMEGAEPEKTMIVIDPPRNGLT